MAISSKFKLSAYVQEQLAISSIIRLCTERDLNEETVICRGNGYLQITEISSPARKQSGKRAVL